MTSFSRKYTSFAVLSFIILAFSFGVHAQENPVKQSESVVTQNLPVEKVKAQTQQVEIKAKNEVENSRRDAAAKTIVTNAELMRYGDTNIADAMKRVPGVAVVNGAMSLPGLSAGYTQVLVDGDPPRGISVNSIPMNIIERVEIYRLGSAEFSSQGIAGTINIVLKKVPRSAQQQIKATISREAFAKSNIEWMSADKYDTLSYSLSISASEYGVQFPGVTSSLEYDKQEQLVREDLKTSLGNSFHKTLQVRPVLQYAGKDGLNIQFTNMFYTGSGNGHDETGYQFLLGRRFPIQKTVSISHSHTRSGSTSIDVTNRIFGDAKLDFKFGVNGQAEDKKSSEVNYSSANELAYNRYTSHSDRLGEVTSTLKLTVPSSEEHDIVAGWDISGEHNNIKRIQVDTGPAFATADQRIDTTHSVVDSLAFFVQDEWKFRKESSAYFGLRWEAVRVQSDGSQQTSVKNNLSVWSPIIQTLWQLNSENTDRLRIGFSRTYEAPLNIELTLPKFLFPNNSIENPGVIGNPTLKPELAWSLQTSFEHDDKEDFSYAIRGTIRKISDLHRLQISYFDDAWWRRPVNAGEGISKVLSFETRFPFKRFFGDGPNIDFTFYVGRTWSSVSFLPKPDNLLDPSKLSANTNIDYTAKDLPLSLGGSLRYRDANHILVNSTLRNFSHPSVNLDVYALWKYSPKTRLRVAIDNVQKRRQLSSSELYHNDSTIWQYKDVPTYRTVRLNFEHAF